MKESPLVEYARLQIDHHKNEIIRWGKLITDQEEFLHAQKQEAKAAAYQVIGIPVEIDGLTLQIPKRNAIYGSINYKGIVVPLTVVHSAIMLVVIRCFGHPVSYHSIIQTGYKALERPVPTISLESFIAHVNVLNNALAKTGLRVEPKGSGYHLVGVPDASS